MTSGERRVGRLAALGYTGISLAAAVGFFGLARWVGEAPPLAILGGTVWVFILSTIISMPLVLGRFGRRTKQGE